jgi:hypothetical protein
MDSLFSFPVGLFHPLQHAGLARRTPVRPSSTRIGRQFTKRFINSFQKFSIIQAFRPEAAPRIARYLPSGEGIAQVKRPPFISQSGCTFP